MTLSYDFRIVQETTVIHLHVVSRWLGNSETIARRHYLKTTQDHFDQAIKHGVGQGPGTQQPQPLIWTATARNQSR